METKSALILRHKQTGLYYSYHADHTRNLWAAWRFPDEENLTIWLKVHSYAPGRSDEYEAVAVKMTIEEDEHEREYGDL